MPWIVILLLLTLILMGAVAYVRLKRPAAPRRVPLTRDAAKSPLILSREIAELARTAPDLPVALYQIGEALHAHLKSRAWTCLRVADWNGETALLRPWQANPAQDEELIDLTALTATHREEPPLGQALATLRTTMAEVSEPVSPTTPWRARDTRRVMALPVAVDGCPLALLEFDDPLGDLPEHETLLDLAAIQLGFVAQRDVTRAHMATNAEHLGRLTLVASRISSGVAITDRDGAIEWVNQAFLDVTGYQDDQVLGQGLPDLLAPEITQSTTVHALRNHLQHGEPFRLVYEARRRGARPATPYWGEIDAIQMLDESGGRGQYVCLFRDITQRKAQEQVREEEHEFQEALLSNLPVSLFVVDPTSLRILAINRYCEIEFQMQRDRVVGRTIEQAMGKAALELTLPQMQAAMASGQTVEHDFTWQSADSARVINARHFALRHSDGRPRLLISLVRDITAARQAQADLEESERRFRELVESMDDAVYVVDGERQQYLYLSPQTEGLLGMSEAGLRVAPRLVRSMVVAEDLPMLTEQEQRERRHEATDTLLRMDIPGKGLRWIRHKTRSRQLPRGESRIYGLVSDVTDERKQALELQRARDLAEAASQAKSQFMANMSHEIRTPMNGILGMTELLLGTPLNDKQRRFAQAVYRSGESLLEIINDILDFAKIEAGHLELATCDFVLRIVVEDTLELMAPRGHEKGLELSFREGPGLPAVIHGDPLRLRQILTNLVANAIKFTEHGEVVVDIRRTEGEPATGSSPDTTQGIQLTFTVRDTGIGIPQELVPRLFSAFVQAHGGMARRYGGTGLGLAISKQLVELMGGQIEVRSTPGMGSEFVFHIPVHVGDAQLDRALLDQQDLPSYNVLVVDDNETNRTVLENMLTAWGMKVTQAENGRQALDILMADPERDVDFDLALVDMNMPELDGLSLAEMVRRSRRYAQLKMVLLSSVSSPDDVQRAQEAGFQRFLSKPLRKAELRQTILSLSVEFDNEPVPQALNLNKNVLVIEDNPVNQEVCSQMLRRLGCEVRVASSALEGLRRLGEHHYDLILMDIQMPGMDGVEALSWFRRGSSKRFTFLTPSTTPVIAVTANALEGDEQRFLDVGFDDYLSKPFRQGQLQRILVEHTAASSVELAPAPPPERAPTETAAEGEPASGQVLDAEALRRLRELDPKGENHLLERVTRAFETSLNRLLPQLSEAMQLNDLVTVAHVAHTLKSSSASIGALKLSQMCAEIEGIIRRQTGEDLSSRIREIPLEADRVQEGLQQVLESQS